MASTDTTRLAVLIDADNASASVAKELLEEVAKFGTAMVKRAFGDWTTQNLVGWKAHLHRHAIPPIRQFAYTKRKNSTDSAFIIDAIDRFRPGLVCFMGLSSPLKSTQAMRAAVGNCRILLSDSDHANHKNTGK